MPEGSTPATLWKVRKAAYERSPPPRVAVTLERLIVAPTVYWIFGRGPNTARQLSTVVRIQSDTEVGWAAAVLNECGFAFGFESAGSVSG